MRNIDPPGVWIVLAKGIFRCDKFGVRENSIVDWDKVIYSVYRISINVD
jgi:hypothetical protein